MIRRSDMWLTIVLSQHTTHKANSEIGTRNRRERKVSNVRTRVTCREIEQRHLFGHKRKYEASTNVHGICASLRRIERDMKYKKIRKKRKRKEEKKCEKKSDSDSNDMHLMDTIIRFLMMERDAKTLNFKFIMDNSNFS